MQEIGMPWLVRVAPSLGGGFAGTPEEVWGTKPVVPFVTPEMGLREDLSCVFFGLYGLPDFYSLWRHKGRRCILWAGSDIQHFINGYFLDEGGFIKIEPESFAQWINKYCESYVENGVEHEALMVMGIDSKIVPSFMGNVQDYQVEYRWNSRPKVYLSVSGDNFAMYGWELVEKIANHCEVDFYLYGSNNWKSKHSNVFVRGRVPKEVMNAEIKDMQCGLRPLEFDGFSEILAKSVLWGQHPISFISYPHIDSYRTNEDLISLLNKLAEKTEPNLKAREYFLKTINQYPWNDKKHQTA